MRLGEGSSGERGMFEVLRSGRHESFDTRMTLDFLT